MKLITVHLFNQIKLTVSWIYQQCDSWRDLEEYSILCLWLLYDEDQ